MLKVIGTDAETGFETAITLDAVDAERAMGLAYERGINPREIVDTVSGERWRVTALGELAPVARPTSPVREHGDDDKEPTGVEYRLFDYQGDVAPVVCSLLLPAVGLIGAGVAFGIGANARGITLFVASSIGAVVWAVLLFA